MQGPTESMRDKFFVLEQIEAIKRNRGGVENQKNKPSHAAAKPKDNIHVRRR